MTRPFNFRGITAAYFTTEFETVTLQYQTVTLQYRFTKWKIHQMELIVRNQGTTNQEAGLTTT
jgi:hypothetical protein